MLLIGLLAVSGRLVAAEPAWTEFRGPTGQGISTAVGLPVEWDTTRNVVWRAPLPGRAWSSPVHSGGRIYLTNAVPLDSADPSRGVSLRVVGLEAASGKVLWDREVFRQTEAEALVKHDKNSHASPTPIIENGRIYAHFGHHGTACLDPRGTVLWSTQETRYPPRHGTGGSPVLVDGLLIFNADGYTDPFVVALDKDTGKVRWRVPRPPTAATSKFSFCTPLVIQVKGQKQVISPGSGIVQALDPRTGAEIWRVMYGTGFSVVPRPIFAHGLVFLSSGYEQAVAYAIRPDGRGDVTATHVAWTATKRIPHNASMVVVGDELYMLDDGGILSCRDARTGELHYEERVVGTTSASLLAAGGRIFALDERGKTAVVKAGKTAEVLAVNELNERTLASLSVCDNDLLLRTEGALYRLGTRRAARN
jgi:outer membrane protein assembly factor BamB